MRGRRHSDETRAAVMASLLAGQGITETARQYNIDASLIYRWRQQIPRDKVQQLQRQQHEHDFDKLLADYLAETLLTLRVQAEFFRNKEWLAKQDAHELAVLHGVATDKAIRLLEAVQLAHEPEDAEPSPTEN
jgi:transposase-like protein